MSEKRRVGKLPFTTNEGELYTLFEQYCAADHELDGSENLDNHRHPETPQGSRWACRVHG